MIDFNLSLGIVFGFIFIGFEVLIFYLGEESGRKNPVKKVSDGFYTAWGGHRKYDYSNDKENFYILLQKLNSQDEPIYLCTKNYLVYKKFKGERVVVDNDKMEIRLLAAGEYFDVKLKNEPRA